MSDSIDSYRFGESVTRKGQAVNFTCSPNSFDDVKRFFKTYVRTVDIPTTGRMNISHGSYGRYTRYDVAQHKYAGGGAGYIEVLEIKNPPDDRCGFVIYEYHDGAGVFTEWETLENAEVAFENTWSSRERVDQLNLSPGLKRRVTCGALTPWFYAVGDELCLGDYAFPEGLQDDPVYRIGNKFVVFDDEGMPQVKTCMGTRFINYKPEYHSKEQRCRYVYWDDGSVWDEISGRSDIPRPVQADEAWIAEAVKQFKLALAGKSMEFTINFINGEKFVGKVVRHNPRSNCAAGDYLLKVNVEGEKKPLQGWVSGFVPTAEHQDIVQYATRKLGDKGQKVTHIEIVESRVSKGGKKWAGVFFAQSPPA